MQKILVPLAVVKLKEGAIPIHFARETFIKKLIRYGLKPVYISGVEKRNMWDETYAACNGIFLMGGTDVDPKLFGEERHPQTEVAEPARDEVELHVLKRALLDKKPILGICRGCQMIAVGAGGSLHQHVPDLNTGEHHRVETYEDLRDEKMFHKVLVEKNSKAHQLLGKDEIMVNTGHHQSVKYPGKGFVMSGKSEKGIVEIIEHTDPNYFCFGIQSHPEALDTSDLEIFFQKFAEELK